MSSSNNYPKMYSIGTYDDTNKRFYIEGDNNHVGINQTPDPSYSLVIANHTLDASYGNATVKSLMTTGDIDVVNANVVADEFHGKLVGDISGLEPTSGTAGNFMKVNAAGNGYELVAGDTSVWGESGGNIHYNSSGNVGIGTTEPLDKLHIDGNDVRIGNVSQDANYNKLKEDYSSNIEIDVYVDNFATTKTFAGFPNGLTYNSNFSIVVNFCTFGILNIFKNITIVEKGDNTNGSFLYMYYDDTNSTWMLRLIVDEGNQDDTDLIIETNDINNYITNNVMNQYVTLYIKNSYNSGLYSTLTMQIFNNSVIETKSLYDHISGTGGWGFGQVYSTIADVDGSSNRTNIDMKKGSFILVFDTLITPLAEITASSGSLSVADDLIVGTHTILDGDDNHIHGTVTINDGTLSVYNHSTDPSSTGIDVLDIYAAYHDGNDVVTGYGPKLNFKVNRKDGNYPTSATIKGYMMSNPGHIDFHALDIDVYGDNSAFHRGITVQSVTGNNVYGTIYDAETIVHGNLGVGTTSPKTILQVGDWTTYDNGWTTFDSGALLINNMNTLVGNGSNGALDDVNSSTSDVLYLSRGGTFGVAHAAGARFKLDRYEHNSYSSRSRLTFNLAHGDSYSTNTDVMSLKSNGYVGIGTTSPSYTLDVDGDVLVHDHLYIVDPSSYGHLNGMSDPKFFCGSIGDTWHGGVVIGMFNDGNWGSNGLPYIASSQNRNGNGGTPLSFLTNNTERIRILAGGNVGIGTTSPSYTLDVDGDARVINDFTVGEARVASTGNLYIEGEQGTGNDASLFFGTRSGHTNSQAKTAIIAEPVNSYSRAKLHFCLETTANNALGVSSSDSRMCIDFDGNVGIGKTSPSYTLDVSGTAHVSSNLTVDGTISGNGSGLTNTPAACFAGFMSNTNSTEPYLFVGVAHFIIGSMPDLNDWNLDNADDIWTVFPGFKFILWTDTNYQGYSLTLDNTDGTVPMQGRMHDDRDNSMSSIQVYYRGVQLGEPKYKNNITYVGNPTYYPSDFSTL